MFGTLVSPSDGDELNYIHILFEWEQQPGNDFYVLDISNTLSIACKSPPF